MRFPLSTLSPFGNKKLHGPRKTEVSTFNPTGPQARKQIILALEFEKKEKEKKTIELSRNQEREHALTVSHFRA